MIALAALALATAAPIPTKIVGVYGFPGNDSCANWTENRADRNGHTQALEGWVLGFLTGYNTYGDETGTVDPNVNSTAMLGWMDNYCSDHPLDTIYQASAKLVVELRARAGRSKRLPH